MKFAKNWKRDVEGRASAKGFGRESQGGTEELISKIHESVGTPKVDEKESSEEQTIDAPPVKTVESVDPEATAPAPTAEPIKAVISTAQVDAIVEMHVGEAKVEAARNESALQEEIKARDAKIESLERDREAVRKEQEAKEAFFTRYGISKSSSSDKERSSDREAGNVAIALRHQQGVISPADAWKEYCNIHDQSAVETVISKKSGRISQRDNRPSDNWFKENLNRMVPAIDDYARSHGLLKGGKEALTSRTDIAPMLLEVLSAYVRINHHPSHIWGMFANVSVELGKRNGETVDVPRFAYAQSRRNRTDWDLTGVASLATTAQAVQAGMSQVTVKEWGMGKPGLPGDINAPIGVSTFLDAISVMDLMPIVNNNLGYNYREFETAQILDGLLSLTPARYYNKKGSVATVPTELVAGDDGTCTVSYLRALAAQMATDKVIPYSNGKYALTIQPNELKTLEESLDPIKQIISRADVETMTQIFSQAQGIGDINYNGYKGDIGDFMIFVTTTLGDGPVAMPAGVKLTETIAGTARPINIGYAFGANSFARGIAMPFTIFPSSSNDFERSAIMVWRSYEGFGALDINEALDPVGTAVPQQNRVFELRFTQSPI